MLRRAFAAEFLGTALLLATVVGSGIMGERLSGGNAAIALLVNTIATGAVLVALVAAFGDISGAHFNPVVSVVEAASGKLNRYTLLVHVAAQILGGLAGTVSAHWMFELPAISLSQHVRTGPAQWWSEVVATFGLITVILQVARHRPASTPVAVGAYITAAYWFTASTSFANPAVTLARTLTDSFSGIRPVDAPAFVLCQFIGGFLALWAYRWMEPRNHVPNHDLP